MSFEALEALGSGHEDEWSERVASLRPEDVALIVYTSGTTGPPKGAMLSHGNLVSAAATFGQAFESSPRDEVLSYLPLCHIAERLNSAINALSVGYVVNFGKGGESFFNRDLRDVQPTSSSACRECGRRWLAAVDIRMDDAVWLKRRLYHWCGAPRESPRASTACTATWDPSTGC